MAFFWPTAQQLPPPALLYVSSLHVLPRSNVSSCTLCESYYMMTNKTLGPRRPKKLSDWLMGGRPASVLHKRQGFLTRKRTWSKEKKRKEVNASSDASLLPWLFVENFETQTCSYRSVILYRHACYIKLNLCLKIFWQQPIETVLHVSMICLGSQRVYMCCNYRQATENVSKKTLCSLWWENWIRAISGTLQIECKYWFSLLILHFHQAPESKLIAIVHGENRNDKNCKKGFKQVKPQS